MGGRSRSRSFTPRSRSPAPRRRRYPDDVPRRGERESSYRRSPPCSLLVRNIPREARPEDVRAPFEKFGHVKDVYLPKDYYSGEPRGFGFVQFMDPADAADAKKNMDHQDLGGREITVVFAEENRKKPTEMRVKARLSSRGGGWSSSSRYSGGSRRSPPARRYRSISRSRSPRPRSPRPRRYHSSRDGGERYERSLSPQHEGGDARSPSPKVREVRRPVDTRGQSPDGNGHHASRRSYSRSPSPVAVRRYSRSRSYSRD